MTPTPLRSLRAALLSASVLLAAAAAAMAQTAVTDYQAGPGDAKIPAKKDCVAPGASIEGSAKAREQAAQVSVAFLQKASAK